MLGVSARGCCASQRLVPPEADRQPLAEIPACLWHGAFGRRDIAKLLYCLDKDVK